MNAQVIYAFRGKNDGSDETDALQWAFRNYETVRIGKQTICVSKQIVMPSGARIIGSGKQSVIKALGNIAVRADNGQGLGDGGSFAGQAQCMVRAGQASQIKNLKFDGAGFKSGGVQVWHVNDVLIEDVWVFDAVNMSIVGTNISKSTSAINCFNSHRVTINRLWVERALYAVQFWRCNNCRVYDSYHNIGVGGFWTTNCIDTSFYRVTAKNMEDVGLDLEGGTDCYFYNSRAESCSNGELAFFNGDEIAGDPDTSDPDVRLQFRNCTAWRRPTYTDLDGTEKNISGNLGTGALFVSSISQASRECGWYNCHITVDAGRGLAFPDLGATTDANDREIEVVGCEFVHNHGGHLFRANGYVRGVTVKENTWIVNAAVGAQSVWKNPDRSSFIGNDFIVNVAPTDFLILVYQDAAQQIPAQPGVFAGNKFYGPAHNEFAVKVQQYDAAGNLNPDPGIENIIFQNNEFSAKPVKWGGLYVDVGARPIFHDQRLQILVERASAGTVDALNTDTGTAEWSSYLFDNTLNESGPFATGIIIMNKTAAGVMDTSDRNIYAMDIVPGGGFRITEPAETPASGNSGALPGTVHAAGSVTLSTTASSTTVNLTNLNASSVVMLTPTSQAAADDASGIFVSAKAAGSFTLTHPINAASRTFDYVVLRAGTPGIGSGSGRSRNTNVYLEGYGPSSQELRVVKPTGAAMRYVLDLTLEHRA